MSLSYDADFNQNNENTMPLQSGADNDKGAAAASLIPSHLPIGIYEVTLRTLDAIELSAFSAATLRGAFGWTFKRMVCYQPKVKSCVGCLLRTQCVYPQVFEPTPGSNTLYEGLQNVPAPYVIRAPQSNRRFFEAGEEVRFQVVLIGHAIRLLAYFAVALQQLEGQGLGRGRGRATLQAIDALHAPGIAGERTSLFQTERPEEMKLHGGWQASDWIQRAAVPDQVEVEFLTLTRLKSDNSLQQKPDFSTLYRALLRRASALCTYHSDHPWQTDFADLAAASQQIQTVQIATRQSQQWRYSSRQERRVELWGCLGSMRYAGDLTQFWPLLQLGQVLHVGKNSTFGLGQYLLSAR